MTETKKPLPEPLPCPWCGRKPKGHVVVDVIAVVKCTNPKCPVKPRTPYRSTLRGALNLWNNRKGCK